MIDQWISLRMPKPGTRVRLVGGFSDGEVGIYQGWTHGGAKIHNGAKHHGHDVEVLDEEGTK